jgi:hypothetical protein
LIWESETKEALDMYFNVSGSMTWVMFCQEFPIVEIVVSGQEMISDASDVQINRDCITHGGRTKP